MEQKGYNTQTRLKQKSFEANQAKPDPLSPTEAQLLTNHEPYRGDATILYVTFL